MIASGEIRAGQGGSRYRGVTRPTSVNTNPDAQPDLELRRLNAQPTAPGPREQVYCTKVGTTRPDEMYIVGAHMDGHGWGEAANDNGSGTALVMELARVFSESGCADRTIDSIRALEQRGDGLLTAPSLTSSSERRLQGREDPAWLGPVSGAQVARHDPARHDAVGPRHAARRRHVQPRAAARSRRQHRVPVHVEARRRRR